MFSFCFFSLSLLSLSLASDFNLILLLVLSLSPSLCFSFLSLFSSLGRRACVGCVPWPLHRVGVVGERVSRFRLDGRGVSSPPHTLVPVVRAGRFFFFFFFFLGKSQGWGGSCGAWDGIFEIGRVRV